ncbi:MAG: Fur family transcriptional regulator [Candidatus Methylacidiphilales bacterium]
MITRPRRTRQKEAIVSVLDEATHPLTAQDIEARAASLVPGIGMATVYRALKRLQEEHRVRVVELPGQTPHYESCHKKHHHHFVCRHCEKVFDVDGCVGDLDQLLPDGFKLEGHEITLFGRCGLCSERAG